MINQTATQFYNQWESQKHTEYTNLSGLGIQVTGKALVFWAQAIRFKLFEVQTIISESQTLDTELFTLQ